ncbi:MAG: VanW family protein [Burkholderiales bacterium]|nr:VanW family protein [Anaerolineae bacterium]
MSSFPENPQMLPPQDYEYPQPRPAFNPWWIRVPVLLFTGLILIGLLLGGLVAAFEVYFQDKIIPNVWSYNINLAGMTEDEAVRALEARFRYDDEAIFTFNDDAGARFWQMTAGELGVSFDAEATAAQAFAIGHDRNIFTSMFDQASTWLNGVSIAPQVTYDQSVALNKLATLAGEIDSAPVSATLTIDGLNVNTTPSQMGRTLDVTATLSQLDGLLMGLDTGAQLPLVILDSAPAIADAEAAAARVRAALAGPVQLVAQDANGAALGPWVAMPEQIAALLVVQPALGSDGTYNYNVSVNVDAFQSFLQELAPGLIVPPQDARFHFNDQTRQLEVFEPGVNGRELNVTETLARVESAIFTVGERRVPMAFNYTLPRYHDDITALDLGITEMVSDSTTFYAGSTQARRENIAQAAAQFDGVIIAPGEEFSYNDILGEISPESGYSEGLVIVGGRTVRGVGGGVCQVSTTAYQAAFYAGFQITERWAHGYRVGYYERGEGVGMDAAIYQPDPGEQELDLRFTNDTPYHLLIETSVYPADDSVQFRFYSTDVGRQVVREGPIIENVTPARPTLYEANSDLEPGQTVQVDWAVEGADVRVVRVILDASGNEVAREPIDSHYEPWGAVIQVAPGDTRLNG